MDGTNDAALPVGPVGPGMPGGTADLPGQNPNTLLAGVIRKKKGRGRKGRRRR